MLSPEVGILTPSLLAVLVSGLPFGAGDAALVGVTATGCLRAGMVEAVQLGLIRVRQMPHVDERTWRLPIGRRLAARPSLCSFDLVLPLLHDLFREVGYFLGIMSSKLADCQTSFALLSQERLSGRLPHRGRE